jgi:scyllo-inositol 2-dehydrogenase (NADP+)
MKLGIIGAGMIVHDFLTFASEIPNLDLQAICATIAEKEVIEHLADSNNINKTYTDFKEFLLDEDVDTVYVAVPNHLHFQFSKDSLNAGKHVICEKPFTSNLREAKELFELAESKHLFIFEAVSTRFLPNVQKIKEELPKLGNIKIFTANYSQYSSRYDAFKSGETLPAFDPQKSGGALMDLNIYNINLVVTLFGKPDNIDYHANIRRGIDTSGILVLDYPTFKFVGIAAKDCKAPIMTNIQGDEGCISVDSSANIVSQFTLSLNTKDSKTETMNINHGKHRMFHEFEAFISIIENEDFSQTKYLQDITLTTMDIQTTARLKAGILFPSD